MSPRRSGLVVSVALAAVFIFLIWVFFLLVPYESISNKGLFWGGFAGWAIPMILVVWDVRNGPPERVRKIGGRAFMGVAVALIIAVAIQSRLPALDSVTMAAMPGVLSGTGIGVDSLLLFRIYKGQIGPGY